MGETRARRWFSWPVRVSGLVFGLATWLTSLVAIAAALVLADLGASAWIFILLGLWLFTLGLPTLGAVWLVASLSGRLPWIGTPPLHVALGVAVLLSLAFQVSACLLISRRLKRRKAASA